MKVRNLKANHSNVADLYELTPAVLATVKVRNLKANHSEIDVYHIIDEAVLATVKVRNLKANHSFQLRYRWLAKLY